MRKKWWMFFLIPPAMALFGWIFGELVMHLWNWLMPAVFGWHAITFWQALGILVLSRILVGGLGGGSSNGSRKRRCRGEKWERMTPEEHDRFREWMQSRRGGLGAPASGTGEPA